MLFHCTTAVIISCSVYQHTFYTEKAALWFCSSAALLFVIIIMLTILPPCIHVLLHMDVKNGAQFSVVIRTIWVYHLPDPTIIDLIADTSDPVFLTLGFFRDFSFSSKRFDICAKFYCCNKIVIAVDLCIDLRACHSDIFRNMCVRPCK